MPGLWGKARNKNKDMMIVKKNVYDDGRLFLAVCDDDLIGKKFEDEKLQLDLTSSFFKGEEKNAEEIILLVKKSYMVNFVGEKSVEMALTNGFVEKENIIKIKNIPTAQMLVMI